MARATGWTLRSCGIRDRGCGDIHRLWLAGAKCSAGQCRARWWSRRAVSLPEFFLVGDGGYCRRVLGFGLGLYEYGEPDWSGAHGFSHSLDRGPLRLDNLISGGGGVVLGSRRELAGGGSIETTHEMIEGYSRARGA